MRAPFDIAAARTYPERAWARRREGQGIQLAITTGGRAALGEVPLFVTGPDGRGAGGGSAELAYAVGAAHRGPGNTPCRAAPCG